MRYGTVPEKSQNLENKVKEPKRSAAWFMFPVSLVKILRIFSIRYKEVGFFKELTYFIKSSSAGARERASCA